MKKMQWNSNFVNKKILYTAAFLIPALLMILVYSVLQISPFGKISILVSDLSIQFVDYFSYFKSILTTKNDFIYTFSKNLGGDMVGFSAYYLQNPLLFILLLFPQDQLSIGISIMVLLQVAFCGLSFSYFINSIYKPRYESLLFSTAYAFMGFIFAYISLPIYFSNLSLLPIVILGLQRIINNYKHNKLYIFSLSLYVFINYYLGFMLCIFTIIYFTSNILIKADSIKNIKNHAKNFASYILSSAIGILLIIFDLVMTAYSLKGQKDSPTLSNLKFYRQFRLMDIFSKLYSGSDKNHELPIIYCSVLVVIFVLLYFLSEKIKIREKIITALALLTLLISFYIHTFNVIWHGFNEPVGFAYRYAYFFSFLMIMIGYQGFIKTDYNLENKKIKIIAFLFILYSAYLFITKNSYVGWKDIFYNGLLFTVFLILLITIGKNRNKNKNMIYACMSILFLTQIIDLSFNAIRSIKFYPLEEEKTFSQYIYDVEPAIKSIKNKDDSLYRIEKDFFRSKNDTMQFNYSGLSHSSSCEKDYVKSFIGNMGFRNNQLFAFYNTGSTSFADSILGVKYLISRFDSIDKPYHYIDKINEYHVYENPYALPFLFTCNNQITDIKMGTDNLFEVQNQIANSFGDYNSKIFEETTPVNINESNLKKTKIEGYTNYQKMNNDKEAYIEYIIKCTSNDTLYGYFNAPDYQSAELFVDDNSYGTYFTQTNWNVINFGKHHVGDLVKIKLVCKENQINLKNALFYHENAEKLMEWFENTNAEQQKLDMITSSHLKGQINISEDASYLVFSIPYEEDWNIKIDHQVVKQEKVLDALMAVEVSPGKHDIEMNYIPKGFYPWVWISLLTFVILMFCIINGKIKDTD